MLPVKTSYFCINMSLSAPTVRADIRWTGQDVVIQGSLTCLPPPSRDCGPWRMSLMLFSLVREKEMMCKMKKYCESSSCANMESSSLSGCECSQVFEPASSLTWGPLA